MSLYVLIQFVLASLAAILAPGPDILYVLTRALGQGRRAGLIAAFGFASGLPVHTLAIAIGLAALLQSSPQAFTALQIAGALYLVYLAWRILNDRSAFVVGAPLPPRRLRAIYLQSLTMNLLNPKVILFFLAFLPRFIVPQPPSLALQIALLGVLFTLLTLLCFGTCALAAGKVGEWLGAQPRAARLLRYFTAAVFFLLAAALVVHRPAPSSAPSSTPAAPFTPSTTVTTAH